MSLLNRNASRLPRGAIFNGRRFSLPDLGIEHEASFRIERGEKVYGVGSCFARAVGRMLESCGHSVSFGGLYHRYNAFNILQTIRWAAHGGFGPEHLVRLDDGRWFDPHGREFTDGGDRRDMGLQAYDDLDQALERVRGNLAEVGRCLREADVMALTLGLAEVWRDRDTGVWLNLMPPTKAVRDFDRRFAVHRTRQAENRAAIEAIFREVRAINPRLKIVATVSPIPLRATFCFDDVLVATGYGKATLRSALQETVDDLRAEGFANLDYFPAFEIVSMQRNNDVYKPTNHLGKPDHLHIREEFLESSVRRVFLSAYTGRGAGSEAARRAG